MFKLNKTMTKINNKQLGINKLPDIQTHSKPIIAFPLAETKKYKNHSTSDD